MMTRRILFAEDDDTSLDRLETAVGDWNDTHKADGKKFLISPAKNEADVKEALTATRFDCALFDLRLPKGGGKPSANVGNALALATIRNRGVPVAIVSANQAEISDEFDQFPQVRRFDKGDDNIYQTVVEWLGEQWMMMEVLSKAKDEIEASAADIFVRRLWPQWEQYAALRKLDESALTSLVTRQYVSHLAELLGADGESNVAWHPFENYLKPPLYEQRAHTGDIFRIEQQLWIVLSPQCDMATGKIPNILMAHCKEGVDGWAKKVRLASKGDADQKKEAEKFLRDHVNQNLAASKHFLAALPGEEKPLLVNFASVRCMSAEEITAALGDRVASLAAPFLPNLVQRFGAYISRAGQPNIDVEHF
jgi:CheY-like chemotaxis protein